MNYKNSLLLSIILLSSSLISAMEEKINDSLKSGLKAYTTYISGRLIHQFGHYIMAKELLNCKGHFYVTPTGKGITHLYHAKDSYFKQIFKAITGKYNDNYAVKPVTATKMQYALISGAGPVLGISYVILMPIANTLYNEYKDEKSFLIALGKTMYQPYLNNKQDTEMLLGLLASSVRSLYSLIPSDKNTSGYKILQSLDIKDLDKKIMKYKVVPTSYTILFLISGINLYKCTKNWAEKNNIKF